MTSNSYLGIDGVYVITGPTVYMGAAGTYTIDALNVPSLTANLFVTLNDHKVKILEYTYDQPISVTNFVSPNSGFIYFFQQDETKDKQRKYSHTEISQTLYTIYFRRCPLFFPIDEH